MVAYHEWTTSFTELYQDFIDAYLSSSYYKRVCGARNVSGYSGGGIPMAGIITMPSTGTLKYTVAQYSSTERSARNIRLKAVKIHD